MYTADEIEQHRRDYLAALRSDDYRQGNGYLTRMISPDGEEDCCLGVACKLALRDGVVGVARGPGPLTYFAVGDAKDKSYTKLPKAVQKWLGVYGAAPELRDPYCADIPAAASALNDGHRTDPLTWRLKLLPLTFRELADLFEEYFRDHSAEDFIASEKLG